MGQRRHLKDANFPGLHEYVDRHGKLRRYLRRRGYSNVSLPADLPKYSQAFMEAFQRALAGEDAAPKPEIGVSRLPPGTIAALVASYFKSAEYRSKAPLTQA